MMETKINMCNQNLIHYRPLLFLQTITDYPRDDPDTNNSLSFNDKTNQNKINPQRRKLPHYQEWKQVIRDIFFYVNLYIMVNSSIFCAYGQKLVHCSETSSPCTQLLYCSATSSPCIQLLYCSETSSPCIQLLYCSETPSPCIQLLCCSETPSPCIQLLYCSETSKQNPRFNKISITSCIVTHK